MWSYPSNSKKAYPLDLVGSSFCIGLRTEMGFTEAKCFWMDAVVAVYGRLPKRRVSMGLYVAKLRECCTNEHYEPSVFPS